MAVLGLRCCAGAFSSCSKWATLCCSTQASLCDGLSYCGAWALGLLALVAAAPPLSHRMFWPIECFLCPALASQGQLLLISSVHPHRSLPGSQLLEPDTPLCDSCSCRIVHPCAVGTTVGLTSWPS